MLIHCNAESLQTRHFTHTILDMTGSDARPGHGPRVWIVLRAGKHRGQAARNNVNVLIAAALSQPPSLLFSFFSVISQHRTLLPAAHLRVSDNFHSTPRTWPEQMYARAFLHPTHLRTRTCARVRQAPTRPSPVRPPARPPARPPQDGSRDGRAARVAKRHPQRLPPPRHPVPRPGAAPPRSAPPCRASNPALHQSA